MNTPGRFTQEQKARAVTFLADGEDPNNIARRFGCSLTTLYGWARAAGVSRPNGNASPLTAAATREAYARWTKGEASLEELAAECGYAVDSMERLLRRAHKSYGEGEMPRGGE